MGFGFLGMIVLWGAFLALLIGGGVLLFRQTGQSAVARGPAVPAARRILDERLARGEIDPEEYSALRTQIEARP